MERNYNAGDLRIKAMVDHIDRLAIPAIRPWFAGAKLIGISDKGDTKIDDIMIVFDPPISEDDLAINYNARVAVTLSETFNSVSKQYPIAEKFAELFSIDYSFSDDPEAMYAINRIRKRPNSVSKYNVTPTKASKRDRSHVTFNNDIEVSKIFKNAAIQRLSSHED